MLRRRWQVLTQTVPGAFLAALGLSGGFLAFVAWDQSHWWRIKEDYLFGWLVPLVAIMVLRERWPRVEMALATCAREGSPRASGWQKVAFWTLVAFSLVGGVLFFLLGSFYRAGAGTSQPGTLAITLGAVGILFPLLAINAPESPAPTRSGLFADARMQLLALFVFPLAVWLISAPLVSAVETQLSLALLRRVVTVVAHVFDFVGVPIEQRGNVLALPNGEVGVEDACSGIRSLTGCLFAGSFLAALYLNRLWKKIVLVGAALALAFFCNILRSLFLTMWAHLHGAHAINGLMHDITGYAVLALTAAGLAGLVAVFNLRVRFRTAIHRQPSVERAR